MPRKPDFDAMFAGLAAILGSELVPDVAPLDRDQVEFLRRAKRDGTAFETRGMWLGDLLFRGLIKPVSEGAWEFVLTPRGERALAAWEAANA